jgi:hypothetical protein
LRQLLGEQPAYELRVQLELVRMHPRETFRRLAGQKGHSLSQPDPREETMSYVRAVEFEGVDRERIAALKSELEGGERPPELPAKELILLHDADAEKSLVLVFFDSEDDYRKGDEALSAMPAGDTPGRRTSVTKYELAARVTG